MGILAPYISRWYFARAIEGVDEVLHQHGYNLMVISLDAGDGNRVREFTEAMVRRQIDALVVICLALRPVELEQLNRLEMPLIALGGPVRGFEQVCIDDYQATAMAVSHLVQLGHRRLGHLVGAQEDDLNFEVPDLRSKAFHDAVASNGLVVDAKWEILAEFTVAAGKRAAALFFNEWSRSKPDVRPTAVFCASDEIALGLLFEARERGVRIPEELSVIGIDNHEFAESAGLSTVGQDPKAQGYTAGQLVLDAINNDAQLRSVVADHQLFQRASTAPPHASS